MISVLLIDDDPSITQIFSAALSASKNFEFLSASTGMQGVNEAKTKKPNFIFLDQILPDLPGNEVLSILKKDQETTLIPVVIFSAYSDSHMKQQAIENGARDYLLKFDFNPANLDQKILQYLLQK